MPSEKILQQKKELVQKLSEKLSSATSGILVDYRGLTVAEDTELRSQLRKADVEYKVVKNNLTRFAAKESGYEELKPYLKGPTSIALTYDDPVAAAKVLIGFSKKNEALEVKAGFIEGEIIDVDEIKRLASLPSKEELIAKVVGGFNAPIYGLANVLNANLRGLAVALNAIAEKKSQEQ